MSVVIETTLGDITVDLFVDERPQTCLNFLKLCKVKYYNLNLFHSVNANFCAQTGDPTGKGDGGESIHGLLKGPEFRFYQGEVQPKLKHDRTGLVSMVSHGQGMVGSQFVITLSPDLGSLDGEHCVFGEVVEGSDVLLKLNEAITDEQHRPYQDIRITHTVVLEDPFPDPAGLGEPPASPLPPSIKDITYSRIPADEPLKDTCTQEELDEMVQAREAAARATILEMVGDLPDADVAPPENVLFVCKLNPVTTDHDLSIIFSRFGKVKSCEVIRDAVTGDSLQYAFVEFENQKACEEAYFKMDNVLIDDRRIHVDFSQSVAKWRGKGKGVEMFGPPPHGGWGNKSRGGVRKGGDRGGGVGGGRGHWNDRPKHEQHNPDRRDRHHVPVNKIKTEEDDDSFRMKNGSRKSGLLDRNKVPVKKEVVRKRKKRSPSSSSSSSDSSGTTTSSDSSDSEPKKKSHRRTEKVLVVVKTPRGKKHRKKRKVRSKTKKYESDSEEEPVRKRKKKLRQRSGSRDSSSEEPYKAKKQKRRASSSEDDLKRKRKRRKKSESSADDSSDEEIQRKISKKNKNKKRRKGDESSDEDRKRSRRTRTKIVKNNGRKKRKQRASASSDSESTSSSN